MRKYLYIYKSEIMSNLQYVNNILFGFIGYFILLFVFFNLWKYLYSDPNELIHGYSMEQTIWYVIVTEILWSTVGGRKLCQKISNDVKSGNIAYNMNKPYDYVGYSLFNHLGIATIKGVIYIILGFLLGILFLRMVPSHTIITILLVLLSSIMATIISCFLIITIGLFSFLIEDSNPLYWVYSKLILILGTLFPIEFFPKMVQPILTYSPIYAVAYGPAKLFVNFSWDVCLQVFITQMIYITIGYILCKFIYNRGVKKLNVNGG